MHERNVFAAPMLLLLAIVAAAAANADGDHDHGKISHPITTDSKQAQHLFEMGLSQAFGFNHDEAAESFRNATREDPECAMCWWGVALALGPNINFPMEQANHAEALAATARALELAAEATPAERAYIEALSERYGEPWLEDRAPRDQAYARAMRRVARSYPDDLDAATLFAEALMDTTPWDYWLEDGSPKKVTEEFLAELESVMKRDPSHPGAAHFMIHTVEKARPELGVPAADSLAQSPQVTGHLRHMASHIYIRVGRYHDATRVNLEAIEKDRELFQGQHREGVYKSFLAPHNVHFLWAASTLEGRSGLATGAALDLRRMIDTSAATEPGMETLQHFWATPLFAMVRFGEWDEILEQEEPPADWIYATGVWRYARALAQLRKGSLEQSAAEREALDALIDDPRLDPMTVFGLNAMEDLLRIARGVVAGETAAARGEIDLAVEWLGKAVELEQGLTYDEPPPWHFPVRQSLGAVLLDAGRAAEAERIYRDDLEVFPLNGWSLYGLAQSLAAQGRKAEAAEVAKQYEDAWQYADLELSASRF